MLALNSPPVTRFQNPSQSDGSRTFKGGSMRALMGRYA